MPSNADWVPRFYGLTHPETKIHDREAATHYIPDRRWSLYQPLVSQHYIGQDTGEEKKYSEHS